jgi:hypothetical protein
MSEQKKCAAAKACASLLREYHDATDETYKTVLYDLIDVTLWRHSEANGKYLGCSKWSVAAIESFHRHGGVVTSVAKFGGDALRHDHMLPRRVVLPRLLALDGGEQLVRAELDRLNVGAVITAREDYCLTELGLRAEGDPNDLEKRYRQAGIDLAQHAPTRKQPEDERHILVVASTNPKRANSNAWHRFNLYVPKMTVAEYIRAGGTRLDLVHDANHGFIEVVDGIEAD